MTQTVGMQLRGDRSSTLSTYAGGRKNLCMATLVVFCLLINLSRSAEPDYSRDIRPLMQKFCVGCHGNDDQQSGLRLDFGSLILQGGDRGAGVKPGDPDNSLLIQALAGTKGLKRMPLDEPALNAKDIQLIKDWIKAGAKVPAEDVPSVGRRKSDHWAFQPVVRFVPPEDGTGWSANAIDRFVFWKLTAEGLSPSPRASRATLIRRVYLDMLGVLPPHVAVKQFVEDDRPDAYARLVDVVLASPEYGERWGRHWLDMARYADSNGFTIDGPRSIWPYRDWVIRSLNQNLSFKDFVTQQLAGDLLPGATRDQIVATGFHRNTLINQEGGTDKEQFRVESVVDRVNTTGAVLMGLTIGCAQCHMHKYDPITQREYYQLFAIFNTCDEPRIPLPSDVQANEQTRIANELSEVTKKLKAHDQARAAGQADWELEYVKHPQPSWKLLSPTTFVSKAGATINKLDEHSLIVGGNGNIPAQDVYTVTLDLPAGKTTAIRLEALSNPGLPKNGPGLADNGNFVLSEITFSSLPKGGQAKPLVIELATVDWQQEGYSVEQLFDGNLKTGWAIGGVKNGSANVNREVIFVFKKPIESTAPTTIQIVMQHQHNTNKYLLGSFRFASTSASTNAPLVPSSIHKALLLPRDKRSAAQKTEIAEAYRRTDQSRRPLVATLNKLKGQESQLKATIPTTMVMREQRKPRTTHIHIRGNFLEKGAQVKAGVPAVLPPIEFANESTGSRLDFANWLFNPDHPLTARVTVNRFWQRLFGLGLVETENDFGTQGELPTHPKLLDWLASEFIRLEWDTKAIHRLILTSATYQQSSRFNKQLIEKDPRNRLLARQSRLRMEAEGIRDLALSASGLLSRKMMGPGVYPPQPNGIYVVTQVSKQWPESQGADRFRRGLYTYFWRSSPYPMLPTFDAPDANGTCTRRTRSNTPLQALTMANGKAFLEFARGFSSRILRESKSSDTETRIRFAVMAAFARQPTREELDILSNYAKRCRGFYDNNGVRAKAAAAPDKPKGISDAESATWTAIARVILNTDEFITRE